MTIPDITRLYKISQLQNYLFNPSLLRRHEVKSMAAVRSRTRVLCEKRRVCVCVCVWVCFGVYLCARGSVFSTCGVGLGASRRSGTKGNWKSTTRRGPSRQFPPLGGGSHRCEQISSISLPTTVCDLLKSTKKKIL